MLTLVCVVPAAGTGCQHVMWYATDGSGTRALSRCGEQFVVSGGREDRSFDGVAVGTIAVDPDGRVAYAAEEEGWWVVVDRRRVGHAFDRVSDVGWSEMRGVALAVVGDADGDHLFASRVGKDATWVIGPPFRAIAKGSLTTNAVGKFAVVGWDAAGARVARGTLFDTFEVSAPFDGIASLSIAPDGAPSYVARRADDVFVVRRGTTSGPYEDVASLDVSADGARAIALVHDEEGWRADDGVWRSDAFDRIGDVRIASRSNGVALRGKRGRAEYVVTDGATFGPYDAVVPTSLAVGGPADRVVWAIEERGAVRVLDGGVPVGGAWSAVERVVVGEDGRLGFVARDGATVVVAVEPKPYVEPISLGAWSSVSELAVTATGSVFVAHAKGRDAIVENGDPRWFDQLVPGSFVLGDDGATWGVVEMREEGMLLVRRDGAREPLDLEGYLGEQLRKGEADWDASMLRRWVRGRLRD